MTADSEIIEKIARNYFNLHDFDAKREVTTSARLIKIALETAFEAGMDNEPDSAAIAHAIVMSQNKYGRIIK